MSAASPQETAPPAPAVVRWFHQGENLVLTLTLGLMVLLPVLEVFLRRFFSWGISGSTAWVQHGTLLVGMVGGAVAAREKRLLSLATANYLQGRWKSIANVFSQGFAAAVTTLLCVAGVRFVLDEMPVGKILAFGVPFWTLQTFIPIGFALVAMRLVWHASSNWKGRTAALTVALVALAIGLWTPISPEKLKWPGIAVLLLATAMGGPVFSTIGGAAMILFWGDGETIYSMPIDHYSLVTNPSLPTIPLFTLAGYFLAEGGAPKRLIRVFHTLFGQLRGGPAIVTAVACAFFTSFTGASGVTILALGGLLMPVLLAARFSERSALGLLTGAGSLGLLFPPCLPVILYAIVANKTPQTNISIEQMFLAGLGPGILLVLLTVGWGLVVAPPRAVDAGRFNAREAGQAVWAAKWELLLPVVAVVALFSGWVTTVEAAAITALYAFAVETLIYRDLKFGRETMRVMTECGLLVGGVLLILGVALGFTNYLVNAEAARIAVDWATEHIESRWVFLLLLNLFLIAVGCLMDIYTAIIVVVPLMVPLGRAFGVDPMHLGVIFLANLELGFLTPPVGMNLFLSSYRFGKPMPEVIRATLPMLGVFAVGVVLITYVPWVTTFLPSLFGH